MCGIELLVFSSEMKAFLTVILLLAITAGSIYLVKPELVEQYLPGNQGKKKVPKIRVKKAKKKVVKEIQVSTPKEEVKEEPVEPEAIAAEEAAEPEVTKEEPVVPAVSEDIGDVPMVLKNVGIIKGEEWVDCAKVRSKLGEEISKSLSKGSVSEVKKFTRKAKNRLLIAQWVVANAELNSAKEVNEEEARRENQLAKAKGEYEQLKSKMSANSKPGAALKWDYAKAKERMARLEAEQKSAHRFSESAADEGGRKLMEQIGGNPEWMEQFAFSGECVRPGMALSIIKKIYKQHPDMLTNPMVRDIATATALEYAKSNWNQQDAVERANFYITAWKNDRLNAVFDDLPMWQRRMVCGCKGDNPYGSIASLTWALENFHLPADRYSGACWRCDYRLNNIYGESIHGPLYYAPFEGSMGENRQAMTYHIGGVCGSLSHFGAFAALANGVPAMTAGEPGHCAFIVLVGDTWTPAYSLSWERGLHWQVFRNVHTYSSLHSASELYSKKQEKETEISNTLRTLAGVHTTNGEYEKAVSCYEKAAEEQPRNWMVWREWRESLEANKGATAEQWLALNDTMCKKLVPLYPELAADHMEKGLAEGLSKVLDAEQLRKAFMTFWKNTKVMGPDRWHIERLANKQASLLGVDKQADDICNYYADILASTANNSLYAPAILNWGNQLGEKFDEKANENRMQLTIKALSKGRKMNAEDRAKVLSPVILAAESNRDLNSFQSLAKMMKKKGGSTKKGASKMPRFNGFPGKLASTNGMIWTSSTSEWDKPHEHPGVLTEEGGSFHTGKDTDAYVVVQLPRQVHLTGVVMAFLGDQNRGRLANLKIQVSENGTDWTDVCQLGAFTEQVMRSDLEGKHPLAKYVRILRPGGPEFFHLNGIYIYGNPAA